MTTLVPRDNGQPYAEIVEARDRTRNDHARRDALEHALVQAGTGVATLLATGLATGASLVVGSQVALRAGVWMQPRPMPHQMAALLEHPMRLRYRNPDKLFGRLGIFAGTTVADLGCGTGLFTVGMAERVGDAGQVHALDIQLEMLQLAHTRIDAARLSARVRFHHSGIHTLPLADSSVDVALMMAVLGELPARILALDEVRRVLKPGARLAISEELPDPAYVPAPLARRWAEEAGFRFGALMGNPFCYTMLLFAE
jgi:ubiquinone/menaquinone biosynthesis C-methylase UbiE